MKNGLLVLNIILTIAVGYLLYAQLSSKKAGSSVTKPVVKDPSASNNSFRIAYFEMDSVEANFSMVKDVKAELSKKEESINTELDKMDKSYRDKVNGYQQKAKAQSMTQVQSEMATQDLMATQEQLKNQKQALDQEYNDFMMRRMKDVKTKIEEFLKEYNKTKNYSYIVSYEQGLFYYKDTAYNITSDVIKGLNEMYKSKKD
ncbi:MAG TPA: OmpH family outer membrane protein [Chitinophagaceae bacterium]|nr:OmpH family outer membrane protein [Chitinophagaceae bacterium]